MYTFEHSATEQTRALIDYRYIGNVPNNYVTFNNETWRIIGVFETENSEGNIGQRIKLIRNEKLSSNMAWNNNDGHKSINEWTTASLNTYLNGNYYNALEDSVKLMIDSVKYYLGGNNTAAIDGPTFYNFERGTTVYSGHSTNWIGKIGLMYPSDYVYTYANGVDNACYNNASLCSSSANGGLGVPTNGWIYNPNSNSYQWTLSPHHDDSSFYALEVSVDGGVGDAKLTIPFGVHPSLYLNPNVQIDSGDGTEQRPYIFKL